MCRSCAHPPTDDIEPPRVHAPHTAGDEQDVRRPLAGEVEEHLAALIERPLRRLHLDLRAAATEACADRAESKGATRSASAGRAGEALLRKHRDN